MCGLGVSFHFSYCNYINSLASGGSFSIKRFNVERTDQSSGNTAQPVTLPGGTGRLRLAAPKDEREACNQAKEEAARPMQQPR